MFGAAALGLVAAVEHRLRTESRTFQNVTSSFWGACRGGHIATAAVLLDHGADINCVGYDGLTPLDAARRSEGSDVVRWLEERDATSANPSV